MGEQSDVDILIVGAGVLGLNVAYWLSTRFECTIAVADLADGAARHTSSRNTGVVHRPYYLDPQKKRVFAQTSLVSHALWESLAKAAGLPWKRAGTLNIGVEESEVKVLEQYRKWGLRNGMEESELELMDGSGVRNREPEVRAMAGLLSRTDVSVDFGAYSRHIWSRLAAMTRFLGGRRVVSVTRRKESTAVSLVSSEGRESVTCGYLINAAGGGALRLAQSLGFAREHATLNFRGEYWAVDEPFASRVNTNIYRPPKFPQYPFLDPHFVVRADGSRQIGPNAVVVPGPYVYRGFGLSQAASFFDRPVLPKARLFANRDFVTMAAAEWRSSVSKGAMCQRVRSFVPGLNPGMLTRRGIFGVRSSVVDRRGFVPEALIFRDEASAHITNFNSPGATGAPAFSAFVIEGLIRDGLLPRFRERTGGQKIPGWDYRSVISRLDI
ncbi:MAG: FAD-dependent oxidoreductase [Nitrososphaerota archaeon]|nr:FAD-dependent oxidoreductase [Nitrososphaerota archaeon]